MGKTSKAFFSYQGVYSQRLSTLRFIKDKTFRPLTLGKSQGVGKTSKASFSYQEVYSQKLPTFYLILDKTFRQWLNKPHKNLCSMVSSRLVWGALRHSVGARLERTSKAFFSSPWVGKTSKASFSSQGVYSQRLSTLRFIKDKTFRQGTPG